MIYRARILEEVTIEREIWITTDTDPRGHELEVTKNLEPIYLTQVRQTEIHNPILVEVLDVRDNGDLPHH